MKVSKVRKVARVAKPVLFLSMRDAARRLGMRNDKCLIADVRRMSDADRRTLAGVLTDMLCEDEPDTDFRVSARG